LLLWRHPEIPKCSDCQAWLYDDRWQKTLRAGQPLPRPRHVGTPCHSCPKAAAGKPNPGIELTERNWLAYEAYTRIKAGAPMPDDAIVQRNCGLIQHVADSLVRGELLAVGSVLTSLPLVALAKGK
jgi:hypothetical protein